MTDNEKLALQLLKHKTECEEKRAREMNTLTELINKNAAQISVICEQLKSGNKRFQDHQDQLDNTKEEVDKLRTLASKALGGVAATGAILGLAILIYEHFLKG